MQIDETMSNNTGTAEMEGDEGEVRRMEADTYQRISSDQVIVDLKDCVRELLDNALDAGATQISIQLGESGESFVRVQDNGAGIPVANLTMLARRHATSKLRNFEEIYSSLETLGFRGEALNSICSMGDMSVCTRHSSELVGTAAEYDFEGKLVSQKLQGREVGTTISVNNLFHHFPVRRREFLRSSKNHMTAVVQLLQSYAIIHGTVKITAINQSTRGGFLKVASLLSTSGNCTTLTESARAVIGSKFVDAMLPFSFTYSREKDHVGQRGGTSEVIAAESGSCKIEGLISNVNEGRRSKDTQFFFINNKPVSPPKKIARSVNETYRRVSSKHCAACIVSMQAQGGSVDFNVTPDKKQVFLQDEGAIARAFGEYLCKVLSAVSSAETSACQFIQTKFPSTSPSLHDSSKRLGIVETGEATENFQIPAFPLKVPSESPSGVATNDGEESISAEQATVPRKPKMPRYGSRAATNCISSTPGIAQTRPAHSSFAVLKKRMEHGDAEAPPETFGSIKTFDNPRVTHHIRCTISDIEAKLEPGISSQLHARTLPPMPHSTDDKFAEKIVIQKRVFSEMEVCGQFNKGFIIVKVPVNCTRSDSTDEHNMSDVCKMRYALFVIDQHASDEKARFEHLNSNCKLRVQPLIKPVPLELSPAEEQLVTFHETILRANGFRVEVNATARCGNRISLSTLPSINFINLTTQDFVDLLGILREPASSINESSHLNHNGRSMGQLWRDYSEVPRPPRIYRILASKSCRSAIMIGQPLSMTKMRDVVCKLSVLSQPWNCPHGRPTVRHLTTISTNMRNANISTGPPIDSQNRAAYNPTCARNYCDIDAWSSLLGNPLSGKGADFLDAYS